ncbi:unnamed protein product [Symbiodinium sp. KB8]|nr:unnamed protein product [Symbiodinium sp. KB8]
MEGQRADPDKADALATLLETGHSLRELSTTAAKEWDRALSDTSVVSRAVSQHEEVLQLLRQLAAAYHADYMSSMQHRFEALLASGKQEAERIKGAFEEVRKQASFSFEEQQRMVKQNTKQLVALNKDAALHLGCLLSPRVFLSGQPVKCAMQQIMGSELEAQRRGLDSARAVVAQTGIAGAVVGSAVERGLDAMRAGAGEATPGATAPQTGAAAPDAEAAAPPPRPEPDASLKVPDLVRQEGVPGLVVTVDHNGLPVSISAPEENHTPWLSAILGLLLLNVVLAVVTIVL